MIGISSHGMFERLNLTIQDKEIVKTLIVIQSPFFWRMRADLLVLKLLYSPLQHSSDVTVLRALKQNCRRSGSSQRASAEELRAAIDAGRKQYWPKQLK